MGICLIKDFTRSKSKSMCFKPKCLSDLLLPDMYLNREVMTTVGKIKYLGVFIDCDAHDTDAIMCQVKPIYARGNILISRCSICNDVYYNPKLCIWLPVMDRLKTNCI